MNIEQFHSEPERFAAIRRWFSEAAPPVGELKQRLHSRGMLANAATLIGTLLGIIVAAAAHQASAQRLVFPENVEAVERAEAQHRRGIIEQFNFADGEAVFTLEVAAPVNAEVPQVAPPAAINKKEDDAEAKAIVAHRAKAAAVRAEAQAKAAKATAQENPAPITAGGLLEQVMKQFRIGAQPARPPVVRVPVPAVEIRHEFVQVQRIDAAGQVVIEARAVPVMVDAAPAANVAAIAVAGDLNGAEQQMLAQMFQPLLNRELDFAGTVCSLNEAQTKSLTDAANTEVKATVRAYLKSQQQPRRVVIVNGIQRVEPAQVMPNKLIENCLTASFKNAKLPEDIAQRYTNELGRRVAFRKQMGIEAFIAAVDDRLFLDATQREKLTEALDKNWNESWTPYVDSLLYNSHLNPPIPNEILLPLLRQEQKDTWQSATQSTSGRMLRGGVLHQWNALPPQILLDR